MSDNPRPAPRDLSDARIADAERRFRAIVSQTIVGIAYVDCTGRLLFVNECLAEMLASAPGALAGMSLHELTAPDDVADSRARFARLVNESVPYEVEQRLLRRDGAVLWVDMSVFPIQATDGSTESALAVVIDLTKRKRAEEERQRSQDELRFIVASITDYAIITLDRDGCIAGWNVGAERLFGFTPVEAIGQSVTIIFTPEDRARGAHLEEIHLAQVEGRAMDERWHVRKDGTRVYVSGVLTPVGGSGRPTFVKVARDLTERKQSEEALQRAHDQLERAVATRTAQLRELLNRLITVQEDERRRIARDLHDDIGQKMTALHLKLDALRRAHRPGSDAEAQVKDAQEFVQQLDRDLDFFTWELRPAALYDLGLGQGLRDFTAEWSRNYHIAAEFHELGLAGERLRADLEIHLYRIAQEALNNIHKHAKATKVEVVLQCRQNEVILSVEDDGVGIDVGAGTARGMGLINMRERAALMNGTLQLERSASGGTTVIVRAPAVFVSP